MTAVVGNLRPGSDPGQRFAVARSARALSAYALEIIENFEPRRGSRHRTVVQLERWTVLIALPGAAPRPLVSSLDEAALEGIPLYIPPRVVEAAFIRNLPTAVTTLIHRSETNRAAGAMESVGMRAQEPFHELRHRTVGARP